MTETELKDYIAAIRPADRDAMAAARQRQAQLAKPPGSLGALEDMSVRLAGVTGRVCPPMNRCRVAVFAADNGVVDEGVSCAPRSVTVQQAVNMTRRKTGMSAMAAARHVIDPVGPLYLERHVFQLFCHGEIAASVCDLR